MISSLTKYLNGAMSYQEACSIFLTHSKNKTLAVNLLKRDTKSNREKLTYEVKKLLTGLKTEIEPTSTKTTTILTQKSVVKLEKEYQPNQQKENTPLHQKVIEKRNLLYRERGHLHGRLHEAKDNDSRKDIAKQIIDVQKSIDEYNRDLRLIETGEIPSKYIKTISTAEDYLEVRNAKMYIARYQKKLTNCTPDQKLKYQKLILKYEAKLKAK